MKFILGTKKYMTEVFGEDGQALPVTVVSAGPTVITQVKTVESDGYNAIQVGSGERKEKKATKPLKGHLKDLPLVSRIQEFRISGADIASYKRGDSITLATFKPGDIVDVVATSKGKGFQGTVKRHGFAGGRRTHGQKHSEREPGTISGGGRAGGRVAKGIRMSGRMGGTRITVRNLKIVQINPETNELLLEGAVPGIRGASLEIVSRK